MVCSAGFQLPTRERRTGILHFLLPAGNLKKSSSTKATVHIGARDVLRVEKAKGGGGIEQEQGTKQRLPVLCFPLP